MIALPGVAIHSKVYESSASLVYRSVREQDNRAVVAKVLKQDYPSPQELTRYRQEYEITRSLNLKGVVKAYSQQDYQRTLVILLEDFGGESLEHWMQQQSDFCPMPFYFSLAGDQLGVVGEQRDNFGVPPRKLSQLASSSRFVIHIEEINDASSHPSAFGTHEKRTATTDFGCAICSANCSRCGTDCVVINSEWLSSGQ